MYRRHLLRLSASARRSQLEWKITYDDIMVGSGEEDDSFIAPCAAACSIPLFLRLDNNIINILGFRRFKI